MSYSTDSFRHDDFRDPGTDSWAMINGSMLWAMISGTVPLAALSVWQPAEQMEDGQAQATGHGVPGTCYMFLEHPEQIHMIIKIRRKTPYYCNTNCGRHLLQIRMQMQFI